jgi:nitroreductase
VNFFELIERRHSVRLFQDVPVETEKVEQILQSITCAPSAGNLQAYGIFLVQTPEKRVALAKAALDQDFIADAPLVLVFCAQPARSQMRYGPRGANLYALQDATIACTFAMLAATALGLCSVWVGAFDDRKVLNVVGDPADLKPVAILPVGYPAEEPNLRPRRPLAELLYKI